MVKLRRVYDSELFLESKKDLDDLKVYLGDNLFDDYMKIRDRIPKDQNEFKDFNKLKKMDKKDIQDFVSSFQSKSDKKKSDKTEGAKKLYEDEDWVVYKITTYPAAQLYGKNTKWCVTGRYPGHESKGEKYFKDYIDARRLDGGYYFYISKKDPKEKYCILQTKDKKIDSIWSADDRNVGQSPESFFENTQVFLPRIKEVNLRPISKYYKIQSELHKAIESENIDLIKDILKREVDLTSDPLNRGSSFLSTAIDTNNKNIVKLILDKGVDPNMDFSLVRALGLDFFSDKEPIDIVDILLKNGADPNMISGFGETPLSLANSFGYTNIVNLLKEYGAKE